MNRKLADAISRLDPHTRYIITFGGADRVMIGSGYPFLGHGGVLTLRRIMAHEHGTRIEYDQIQSIGNPAMPHGGFLYPKAVHRGR